MKKGEKFLTIGILLTLYGIFPYPISNPALIPLAFLLIGISMTSLGLYYSEKAQ